MMNIRAIVLATLSVIGSFILLAIAALMLILIVGVVVKYLGNPITTFCNAAVVPVAVLVLIIMGVSAWKEFYARYSKDKEDD